MPEALPKQLPVPLPVEEPEFDPFFVPDADPKPNPNYDPTKPPSIDNPPLYQPGVEVRPAPTPSNPWQVEVTPTNTPIADPNYDPNTVRDPRPIQNPSTQTPTEPETGTNPGTDPGTDPGTTTPTNPGLDNPNKPPEEVDNEFCLKNPDILACQVLKHEDDDTVLPTYEIEFDFNPFSGFSGTKQCPQFPSVGNMLGGRQISWQPFCDSLAMINPLIIAFAWLSAAFIFLRESK